MSQTRSGFTRFDTISEFENYIKNLKITRTINGLQVHHMALPEYSNFYKSNNTTEDELTRTVNLDSYGRSKGWGGIAQHFNIFPNGKITTGRNINKTPVGITGWNTNKICIEIYGNFDKNKDIMTQEQRKAVIAVYAILCERFKLTPSTTTIRPHAWFTSKGAYLGDYSPTRSRKTCPGTNFMGFGNTKAAFVNNFYPLIKNYMANRTVPNNNSGSSTPDSNLEKVNLIGTVATSDGSNLNMRKGPSTSYGIITSIPNKTKINITGKASNGWLQVNYNNSVGYVNGKYVTYTENTGQKEESKPSEGKYIVRYLQTTLNNVYKSGLVVDGIYGPATKAAVKEHLLKEGSQGEHVVWLQKALINRGQKITADGIFGSGTKSAVIAYQKSRGLTADGIAGLDTHTAIVND